MNNKLRIGIIGTGYWGESWIPIILGNSRCELSGIFGRTPENAYKLAATYQLDPNCVFTDLNGFLEEEHNLVVVTVHHADGLHKEIGEIVIKQGKNLLMEKPLCDNLKDAEYLVDMAEQYDRKLIVSQNFRYHDNVMRVKEWLAQGIIGRVISADVQMRNFFSPYGPEWRRNQPYPQLLELGIHSIDLIRYFFDTEAETVFAHSMDVKDSHLRSESFTSSIITLKNGITVNWSGTAAARGHKTDCTGEWHIYGTQGVIHIHNENATCYRQEDREEIIIDQIENSSAIESGRALLLEACLDGLLKGSEISHTGKDNLNSLVILFAAIQSSEQKQLVYL